MGSNTAVRTAGDSMNGESARPMIAISDYFFDQHVAKVRGKLLKVNDQVVHLPLRKEKIAEELCFFVDWSGSNEGTELKGLANHNRAAYAGLMRFGDRYGNAYNYLAFKGVGIPKKSMFGIRKKKPFSYFNDIEKDSVFGLEREVNALWDWQMSNLFLRKNIRTAVPVALMGLDEIALRDGKLMLVSQAVKEWYLPATREYCSEQVKFDPVLYLKGFSEAMRVADMQHAGRKAYKAFAASRGMKTDEYVRRWSAEVARNVALMHNLGKQHGYLTSHNITLDGAIVDLDSVTDEKDPVSLACDVNMVVNTAHNDSAIVEHFDEKAFLRAYFGLRKSICTAEVRKWVDIVTGKVKHPNRIKWDLPTDMKYRSAEKLVALARK